MLHKAQISVDNPGKFDALFQQHITNLGQWFFTSSLVEIGHSVSISKKQQKKLLQDLYRLSFYPIT